MNAGTRGRCWSTCVGLITLAKDSGWTVTDQKVAATGSIYVKLRRGNERAVLRVSNHRGQADQRPGRGFMSVRCQRLAEVVSAWAWLARGVRRLGGLAPAVVSGVCIAAKWRVWS